MEARPYQQTLINDVRDTAKTHKRILIVLPTGGGKTIISTILISASQEKGKVCWFIVHRIELVHQTAKTFAEQGIEFGLICQGVKPEYTKKVQICMVGTLASRIDRMPTPDMIFYDEAHHAAAMTWQKISTKFPSAFHIGMTATPQRRDKKGLSGFFDTIVEGPSTRWLIKNGFLSEYQIFIPIVPDLEDVRIVRGDFEATKLAEIMAAKPIMGSALDWYRKKLHGKRAIAFCCGVANSKAMADQFNAHGIPSAHVDGETPRDERDDIIEKFRNGELLVLCNVSLFGEGFDVPVAEGMLDIAPTTSLGAYLQRCGRVLRPRHGKVAVILDHAGNMARHGPPHIDRAWSLDPPRQKETVDVPTTKLCPQCMSGMESFIMVCRVCLHEFEADLVDEKKKPGQGGKKEIVDTEMMEYVFDINESISTMPEEILAANPFHQIIGMCKTLDDFKKVGRARGYHHRWASVNWAKRHGHGHSIAN